MTIFKSIVIIIGITIVFIYANLFFKSRHSKKEKQEYAKRTSNYMEGRFVYPREDIVEEQKVDKRISTKGKSPKETLPESEPIVNGKVTKDKVTITWFGHSTILLQMHGMIILFDPIFSKRSSPLPFIGPKRFSNPPMQIEELPEIDILIISHNHYDHLDVKSIKKLDDKVKKYIVPLGIEKHLKRLNIETRKIHNLAWWEEMKVKGLTIACTPVRHFSNRMIFDMGKTLYASWVLKDDRHKIFESGDSGFGKHFEEIHRRYGDFDLALMECGQYNMRWHKIHMFPEESIKATEILQAKISMPMHWGTFVLSDHAWDDPVERFILASEKIDTEVITPKIGETVFLDKYKNYQEKWWKDID